MENKLSKIDPQEFGLKEDQVISIEKAFLPKIEERDGLEKVYGQLIKKELTVESCSEAGELRRKLVKVRTGIAEIHKTQKAFFLAAGRFVDAWKNKETLPVEQMEEKLSEMEKYFENIEKERIEKLELERIELTKQFTEYPASNLGSMNSIVFNSYLLGLKVAYEAKLKAEQEAELKRIEELKLDQLETDRKNKAMEYRYFWNMPGYEFRSMSNETFDKLMLFLERAKIEHEQEQKRIKEENEKLQKEAIKKEKERVDSERKLKEQQEIERKKWEERDRIEKEARAKLAAELQAKKDVELQAEQERIKAEKEAAKAPDKNKLIKMVDSIIIIIPDLSDANSIAVANVINAKFESFKKWAVLQIKDI